MSYMNRAECHQLARERMADVKALLASKRWALAYYIAGYAVECALKACIQVRISSETEVLFEDRRFSEKCWTHNLEVLFDCAGLKTSFDAELAANPDLKYNWTIVRVWNEASRYEFTPRIKALELFESITDKKHGVLTWIKRHW
jgi:hypothetical protein